VIKIVQLKSRQSVAISRSARQALEVAPTPEPAVWPLMILGFGAAGASLRQRRRLAA
jgi:hypothetical protein